MAVKPVPEGFHTVTPFMSAKGADKLIDFLKRAFGAEEVMRMPGPDGVVMHAEVNIGNSRLMVGEAMQTGPTQGSFYLYLNNVDAVYKQAVAAGAKSEREPKDEFWGDRMGTVKDPFGNTWSIATHKADVPPAAMPKRLVEVTKVSPPATRAP